MQLKVVYLQKIVCPQCEHIKYMLKLFNGVFLRRAALHTFMSAYAKVNSLNIKGSKKYIFGILLCSSRGHVILYTNVAGAGRILHNIVVSPRAAGCRPLALVTFPIGDHVNVLHVYKKTGS